MKITERELAAVRAEALDEIRRVEREVKRQSPVDFETLERLMAKAEERIRVAYAPENDLAQMQVIESAFTGSMHPTYWLLFKLNGEAFEIPVGLSRIQMMRFMNEPAELRRLIVGEFAKAISEKLLRASFPSSLVKP